MDLFERARLYGQAVSLIDEYLGSEVREKVMARFSEVAGTLQRRGLRDPWDMIAQAAAMAGVAPHVLQALQVAYKLRIKEPDPTIELARKDERVLGLLREWGLRLPGN